MKQLDEAKEHLEKAKDILIDINNQINRSIRCRAVNCFSFDKNNGCIKKEIIISNSGKCICYERK